MVRLEQPRFTPIGDGTDRLILKKDFFFIFVNKGITWKMEIPAGFISDGSSMPVGILYQRKDARMWRAFGSHDFGFASGIWPVNICNLAYYYEGIQGGMAPWRMKTALWALNSRFGGVRCYNNNREEESESIVKHSNRYGLKLMDSDDGIGETYKINWFDYQQRIVA